MKNLFWQWVNEAMNASSAEVPVPFLLSLLFFSAVGVVLLIQSIWDAIPRWIKNPRSRKRQSIDGDDDVDDQLQKGGGRDSVSSSGSSKRRSSIQGGDGVDGMGSIYEIALKCQTLFDQMQEKLQLNGDNGDPFDIINPFLATAQLMAQYKQRHEEERTKRYVESGRKGTLADLEGLAQRFEFADLAYEMDRVELQDSLRREGYQLLRHDTTALPGYLGHYLAINKEKRIALIGVKGTSSLEDLLTDCCALGVEQTLDDGSVVTCHEGIFISAKRLADDLQEFVQELILPAGYQLEIVGHSLGAGGAAVLALLLKTRIPALRRGAGLFGVDTSPGKKTKARNVKVWAFASPPILDYETAQSCGDFILTIVNNTDIVPRASLSNLAITLDFLKKVNVKLQERGLDTSTAKSTIAFYDKLSDGAEGDLLMDPQEAANQLRQSTEAVAVKDSQNLFCPGQALIMYDSWNPLVLPTQENGEEGSSTRTSSSKDGKQVDDDEAAVPSAIGFVVSEDGSCSVLRTFAWNQRMFADHFSAGYRSSLKSVLKLVTSEPKAAKKDEPKK